MFKRFVCMFLLLALLPVLPVFAQGADLPEISELSALAAQVLEKARASETLNDPTEAAAQSEDGYAFVYDFGILYLDRPELDENSVVKALVILNGTDFAFRGLQPDSDLDTVLLTCGNNNPDLDGTMDAAALGHRGELPDGVCFGLLRRDGQQVQTVEYTIHQPADGGYTDTGVTFTMESRLVTAIRLFGLDQVITEEEARQDLDEALALESATGYQQVAFSYTGTDLDPFGPDDLAFSGIDFALAAPESLGEALEEEWMEEEESGTWLRAMTFDGFSATFACDSEKQHPVLMNLTIDGAWPEGPRCVRVGDPLHEVLNRFRNEEALETEEGWILYGTPGTGSWGLANYGDDASAVLRYGFEGEDGTGICLVLWFDRLELSGMTIYRVTE